MQPYMVCGYEFHVSLEQTVTAYRDEEGVECTAVCIGTSEHVCELQYCLPLLRRCHDSRDLAPWCLPCSFSWRCSRAWM